MELLCYETPKAGIDDFKNEDSIFIRHLNQDSLMVLVSDGASTGVFSKEWSDHITHNFDTSWLKSIKDFEFGLTAIRESFKPNITRQTALRKFLKEGSYATLLAVQIDKDNSWFRSNFSLTSYSVGDVCIFIFNEEGILEHTFPYQKLADFNNIPYLIRTSDRLQEKTPYEVKIDHYTTSQDNLIVVASDALSEYFFQASARNEVFKTIKEIIDCQDNDEFKDFITILRKECDMKNDDVSVCFVTERPDIYFPKR